MDVKQWTRQKNRKMRKKMLEQDADTRGFHSSSYHRYFEGYTEYRRLQPNGCTKLIREYTGKWYRQVLTTSQRIILRIVYFALFILMTVCFMLAGTSAGASGASWCAALIGLATILFMTAMAYVLFINYFFSPEKMTIGEYKSASKSLQITAIGNSISFLLGSLLSFGYMLLHQKTEEYGLLLTVMEYIICAAIAFLIYKIECSIKYETSDNHSLVPEDGVEITTNH